MKRIVHGATYDTASSTRIAAAEWEHPTGEEHTDVLYQTSGGAFFVRRETTLRRRDEEGALTTKATHHFDPMSREEAHEWMLQGDIEVVDDTVFKLPPEAAATDDPTEAQAATVYVRVPPLLKETIEAAAKELDSHSPSGCSAVSSVVQRNLPDGNSPSLDSSSINTLRLSAM